MAREKFPSDDIDRVMVRFPAGMRDQLKAVATANKRSVNSEIVARLEASLLRDRHALENEDHERRSGKRLVPEDLDLGLKDALRKIQAVADYMAQFKIERSETGMVTKITQIDADEVPSPEADNNSLLAGIRKLDL